MNFTINLDDFTAKLSRANRDIGRAKENFFGQVDFWNRVSAQRFAGLAEFSKAADRDAIEGVIAGKPFTVNVLPAFNDGVGFLTAVVTQPYALGNGVEEIGRFNVSSGGEVVAEDGSPLVDIYEEFGSGRVLLAILQKVLESPVLLSK